MQPREITREARHRRGEARRKAGIDMSKRLVRHVETGGGGAVSIRSPDDAGFWADLGLAHAILAAYELDHERDPEASLAEVT